MGACVNKKVSAEECFPALINRLLTGEIGRKKLIEKELEREGVVINKH